MKNLGKRLRNLRHNKSMTLKQVADKTDLSTSFLSQVEHSKSSITIESLMRLSEAFEVDPSFFFSNTEKHAAEKKIAVNKHDSISEEPIVSNFTYKDLSGRFPEQTFLPTLVTLQSRKKGVQPLSHSGQEFIYVLQGTLTIIFDHDEITLKKGESIHMKSTIPHNWINKTDVEVKFIYVSAR